MEFLGGFDRCENLTRLQLEGRRTRITCAEVSEQQLIGLGFGGNAGGLAGRRMSRLPGAIAEIFRERRLVIDQGRVLCQVLPTGTRPGIGNICKSRAWPRGTHDLAGFHGGPVCYRYRLTILKRLKLSGFSNA